MVVLWFLSSFPAPPAGATGPAIQYSVAGMIGHALEHVFAPIGFNWQISIALVPGLAAREVAVGALGTVYALSAAGDSVADALSPMIAKGWSLATAYSLLAWYVFAPQCLSTLAVVKRETNSWRYPLIMAAYLFALAYVGVVRHLPRDARAREAEPCSADLVVALHRRRLRRVRGVDADARGRAPAHRRARSDACPGRALSRAAAGKPRRGASAAAATAATHVAARRPPKAAPAVAPIDLPSPPAALSGTARRGVGDRMRELIRSGVASSAPAATSCAKRSAWTTTCSWCRATAAEKSS